MAKSTIRKAYDAGVKVAKAYKPGDVFLGSMPEARARGYELGTVEYVAFSQGYLSNLARPVVTERNTNKIVSIG